MPAIVRATIREIGYDDPTYGFEADSCAVITSIQEQSPDIAIGVDIGGAGDQGMMYGYATNETDEYMPLPIVIAHKLTRRLTEVRKHRILSYLRPDGKSQVTVRYIDDKPVEVTHVVIAIQHDEGIEVEKLREDIKNHVVNYVIPEELRSDDMRVIVNGTGKFVVGGPQADTGVTGRKIMVDTYGGLVKHGGGCFSGKDPSKVDRSATYFARYVTKNCVAAGFADKMELHIAYVIGKEEPTSIAINAFGTAKIPEDKILEIIKEHFDFTPRAIIKKLDLLRPIYRRTAAYGHFGRKEEGFTWEMCDMKDDLRKAAGL